MCTDVDNISRDECVVCDDDGEHIQGYDPYVCRVATPRPPRREYRTPDPSNQERKRTEGRGRREYRGERREDLRRRLRRIVRCACCGRGGHSAAECDFLAMYILCERWRRSKGFSEDIVKKALQRWEDRYAAYLRRRSSTRPSDAYEKFVKKLGNGFTLDQISNEMDWDAIDASGFDVAELISDE